MSEGRGDAAAAAAVPSHESKGEVGLQYSIWLGDPDLDPDLVGQQYWIWWGDLEPDLVGMAYVLGGRPS